MVMNSVIGRDCDSHTAILSLVAVVTMILEMSEWCRTTGISSVYAAYM